MLLVFLSGCLAVGKRERGGDSRKEGTQLHTHIQIVVEVNKRTEGE